jgi:hypothetical protein
MSNASCTTPSKILASLGNEGESEWSQFQGPERP